MLSWYQSQGLHLPCLRSRGTPPPRCGRRSPFPRGGLIFNPNDIVSTYSRAEALEDGVLVDATAAASETGFKLLKALTQRAWAECVAVPKGLEATEQERGRLHNVLFIAFIAAKLNPGSTAVGFPVKVLVGGGRSELKQLYLPCGPGDDLAPVLTILMEGED